MPTKKNRYAVVGLGHIAQIAVLPAFIHAQKNSLLTALVSDDPVKRKEFGKKWKVPTFTYEQYDEFLKSGIADSVYIALPNSLHKDYAIRAMEAGLHILCEKPLTASEEEALQMISTARKNKVKLMTAYRLHFEKANLKAIQIIRSGKIGEPRLFTSVFSQAVMKGNVRLKRSLGGGSVWDMGIYCLNAARYLFGMEPYEVSALSASKKGDPRFKEVDEMTSVILRFPKDCLASFTSSFGAADAGSYELLGTKGSIRLSPSYEYVEPLKMTVTINSKKKEETFGVRDQFAAQLVYFSDCVLHNKKVEPSGKEGLADVRIIEAIYRSARIGRSIKLKPIAKATRPNMSQEIHRPAVRQPEIVHSTSPSGR